MTNKVPPPGHKWPIAEVMTAEYKQRQKDENNLFRRLLEKAKDQSKVEPGPPAT
jgi:hypothetical protein